MKRYELFVRVFLTRESEKPVFARLLSYKERFDYDTLLSAFYLLYGKDCVVTFKVSCHE